MHTRCPVCGQPTEIEVGFYYGTSYVSYAITVLLSMITFAVWWFVFGFSLYDNSIFYWLLANGIFLILLQPLIMRFCRTLWLSWFVKYNPNWSDQNPTGYERVINEQMNNW